MRRATPVLIAVLLSASLWGLRAAVIERAPEADVHPTPWLPSESWPGGKQFDPRLDQSVSFWAAGIPLKDVFAGVKEQTGVEIGFFPAGDDNQRICVTLYLNRDNPPTLRDLMAQLSWVTDSAFALRPGEADQHPTYYLLATSIKDGSQRRLREEQAAWVEEWRGGFEDMAAQNRAKLSDKLEEFRDALSLSREELIKRYKGKDDLLLLALLDSERRAAVEFVLGLPEEDHDQLLQDAGLRRDWADWSPQQRSALRQLVEPGMERFRRFRQRDAAATEEWDWEAEDAPIQVSIGGAALGRIFLRANSTTGGERRGFRPGLFAQGVRLVDDGRPWSPDDTVALREALGETVTDQNRDAIREEFRTTSREGWATMQTERAKEALQARLDGLRPLSPEVAKVLSDISLPLDPETGYPLWSVQEAAAAASGFHVISDCFWQPARSLEESLDLLYGDERPSLTALLSLRLLSLSTTQASPFLRASVDDESAGWDWEDAGRFLRFRSKARDLWRAAFLPADILERVHTWLTPYAEQAVESGADASTADVTLDLRDTSWLAASLDDFQLRYGGRIAYADPADREQAFLHGLRETAFQAISGVTGQLRLFATFSEEQWQKLRGPGIRPDADLTPDQQRLSRESRGPGRFRGDMSTMSMTLGAPGARPEGRRGGGRFIRENVKDSYPLEFSSPERRSWTQFIPHTITVQLRPPSRLVEIEEPEKGM